MLPRQETIVVEMVTTKNDVGKFIGLTYVFAGDDKDFVLSLYIHCDDVKSHNWSYVLNKCTDYVQSLCMHTH